MPTPPIDAAAADKRNLTKSVSIMVDEKKV